MIEFRYPFILYFYFPLLFIWFFLFMKNKKNKLLANTNKSLRAKLLNHIDANRLSLIQI